MKWLLIPTGLTFIVMLILEGMMAAGFTAAVVFMVGLVIYLKIRSHRIIKCTNCGFLMTYGQFKRNGGCIRCGTDLYHETGGYPKG